MKEFRKKEDLKVFLFVLAFIEGGAVMCIELCSAKILSPYFGTSIYVWASVLGVTLTALMSGYYLGGFISSNYKKIEIVFWIILVAGLLITLTPLISGIILPLTIQLEILPGTVISLICILFIPLMLCGATSPLIINLLTNHAKDSGKSSGNVYAISTLGGIIATFTIGFYTFPQFGITLTLYVYGLLVILISTILFFVTKTFKIGAVALIAVAILTLGFKKGVDNKEVIYRSEGILGEIKVVDRKIISQKDNSIREYRELMVNNISQTFMDKDNPNKSYWDYVNLLSSNINSHKSGNRSLLLGLGGGTLYKQLVNNNIRVDIVELDRRIEILAKEYFYIDNNVEVVIDDARHFIRTTKNKYDIIIYDLYHSETPPVHLLTKEAFQEIDDRLNKGGILTINFYGFISGDKGKAARSIYKTLLNQNFNIRLLATKGEESSRNLIFICKRENFEDYLNSDAVIQVSEIDINDAIILTDDKPILEHMYLEAALLWRRGYNEMNTKFFLNK